MLDRHVSRRKILAYCAALASVLTARGMSGKAYAAEKSRPFTNLTARQAIAAMKRGNLAATDYATALLDRVEQGRTLNTFITLQPERVLEAARAADKRRASGADLGPLHGLRQLGEHRAQIRA